MVGTSEMVGVNAKVGLGVVMQMVESVEGAPPVACEYRGNL